MSKFLCMTFRFIQPLPLFHGKGDADKPEWPPSPMRAYQALVNAASLRGRGSPLNGDVRSILRRLEIVRPRIVAPVGETSTVGFRSYVPHNLSDLVTAAWHRGNSEASIASYRVEKDYRPTRIEAPGGEIPAIHYLYPVDEIGGDSHHLLESIRPIVRSISALGWGIDQVAADATLLGMSEAATLNGQRWAANDTHGNRLRVPREGSLDALGQRHERFLNRLHDGSFTQVPPFRTFRIAHYRGEGDPIPRPYRLFELRGLNGERSRYPHRKLIHLAGMVRHLAIEAMKFPPQGVAENWVDEYVAGHSQTDGGEHRQLSYLPLPSVGHHHADPGIRRFMIAASPGEDAWLDYLVRRIAGCRLRPELGNEFGKDGPPLLVPIKPDGVTGCYTNPANVWHSFTPVILPGHGDHKPGKTRKLIERALAQSGIDQPCSFEWSAQCHFAKSYSAHKYDRDKKPAGYFRPNHLLSQTAVHLTLTFSDGLLMPGPMAIGAGRHCGLGLMVGQRD